MFGFRIELKNRKKDFLLHVIALCFLSIYITVVELTYIDCISTTGNEMVIILTNNNASHHICTQNAVIVKFFHIIVVCKVVLRCYKKGTKN